MSITEKTILIVDDMKSVRAKLKLICEDIGLTKIFEASTGSTLSIF
ncbi:MAG: hypothetical protein HC902_05175 [Calothrix sp. SM1_5_4]|nr:hypothetical protein [Calothrix sp. SM1_5_4]